MRKLASLLCVSISLLIPLSSVQAAPPLADRVPADSTLYLGWAGKTAAFDSSMVGQLVNEPGFKEVVTGVRAAILQAVGQKGPQAQAALDHVMGMLGIVWQHPVALAASTQGIDPAAAKAGNPVGMIPDLALLIDLGADRAKFDVHLQALMQMVQAASNSPVKEVTSGNVKYQVLQLDPKAPAISLGYMGEVFFVTVGADTAAKVIALAGAPDKSLAKDPRFLAAYKEVAGENELSVSYLDATAIFALLKKIAPDAPADQAKIDMAVKASGLSKVTAMVSSTRVVDKGMYSKSRILSPAPHQGVLMLLAGQSMSAADLAVAPGDADFVVAFKMDPTQVLAEVRRIAGEIDPRAAAEMDRALMMASTMLKMSIENDLLANLGDQWTLVSAPSLGGSLTGTALVVQAKDAQKLAAAVTKLEEFGRMMLKRSQMPDEESDTGATMRLAGSSIRSYMAGKTKVSYAIIRNVPVVAPAWAIHNDKLIIAAWPQVVEAMIQGTNTGTLDKTAGFKSAFQHISGKPSIITYSNWLNVVRGSYGASMLMASTLTGVLGNQGIVVRPEWLPPLPTVEKYVGPSASAIIADDKGITGESYDSGLAGSLGMTSITTLTMSTAILLPALGHARESAKEAVSQSNLNAIGKGIMLEKMDKKDVPPETLERLIRAGLIAPQTLISPLSNTKAYVYIRPSDDAPGDTIMAYEDPATHGRPRTAVLYVAGNVAMVPVDQKFRDAVKQAQENSEKAYGKDGKAGEAGENEGF